MSDYLVNLGRNKTARKALGGLGVPVPMTLRRAEGPTVAEPLAGRTAWVGGAGLGLAALVGRLGAEPTEDAGDVLLLDASELRDVAGLKALHEGLHPRIRGIGRCGRIVVVGRPESAASTGAEAAAAAALDGFVRSVGKEVGRKGATANLLRVAPGAEAHLEGVLRFVLSDRSAYISGQPFDIGAAHPEPAAFEERALGGKVALVTGAARGIGAATAHRLSEEGATVVLLDRDDAAEPLDEVARAVGGQVLLADVTDPGTPARVAALLSELGGVDVVVHNAGVTRDRTLGRMPASDWDLVMQVNLQAILALHEAMAAGPLRDGARVVLLSSTVGIAGNVGQSNYAATKAAVAGLARRWAQDLAPRRIGVNAVAPGFIETRMTASIPFVTREGARRLNSLSQGGLPGDVAEAITFLGMPGSRGITGSVLRVCGGSLIGA